MLIILIIILYTIIRNKFLLNIIFHIKYLLYSPNLFLYYIL